MRTRAFAVSVVIVASLARESFAGTETPDPDAARTHFQAGRAHVRAGRCDLAVDEFRQSIALTPNVGAWLNLGECLDTLGRPQEAYAAVHTAEALAEANGDERLSLARAAAQRLEARFVRVAFDVGGRGEELAIAVDGAVLPRELWSSLLLSPSEAHTIEVRSHGQIVLSRQITGRAGERLLVALAPEPMRAPPPPDEARTSTNGVSALRIGGYVTAAGGVATTIAGGILGVLALSARSDLATAVADDPRCTGAYPGGVCAASARQELQPLEDRAEGRALASTIVLASGVALLATGIVLVIVAPPRASAVGKHGPSLARGWEPLLTW